MTFLFVGWILPQLNSADGTRSYTRVFSASTTATYKKVDLPTGAWGIRTYSPLAKELGGYDGSRDAILTSLVQGLTLRPIDALPWHKVLAHATGPHTDPAKMLGADELPGTDPPRTVKPSDDNLDEEEAERRRMERSGESFLDRRPTQPMTVRHPGTI